MYIQVPPCANDERKVTLRVGTAVYVFFALACALPLKEDFAARMYFINAAITGHQNEISSQCDNPPG
jgi:hypothetical protein